MRAAALGVLVGLLAVGAAGASTTTSGLYGKVTRGPIAPVCVAEQPCSEPAAGVLLKFSRGGKAVASTRSRADGSYRIGLAPALYKIKLSARSIDPSEVTVRSGRFRHVDFSIDTGIR
jgi:hypothetical protein